MQGELAATAVNAPMVPAEVLAELQPFVALSQGLGTAAVGLVRDTGFTDVKITYASPRYASTHLSCTHDCADLVSGFLIQQCHACGQVQLA